MSRIVVTGRVPDAAIEKLRLEHEVDAWLGPESISPEELLRRVAGADAILSLLTERVDGELLDAAGPQLKVVANVAVGYDNIDVAACWFAPGRTSTWSDPSWQLRPIFPTRCWPISRRAGVGPVTT